MRCTAARGTPRKAGSAGHKNQPLQLERHVAQPPASFHGPKSELPLPRRGLGQRLKATGLPAGGQTRAEAAGGRRLIRFGSEAVQRCWRPEAGPRPEGTKPDKTRRAQQQLNIPWLGSLLLQGPGTGHSVFQLQPQAEGREPLVQGPGDLYLSVSGDVPSRFRAHCSPRPCLPLLPYCQAWSTPPVPLHAPLPSL